MTSKEQADDIVNKISDEWCVFDYDRVALSVKIKHAIPLTELLEVVKAAEKYAGPVSDCCMTGERTGETCEIHAALSALRATNKIKGL